VRTLYPFRHAKSSWAALTLPDRERPLAPLGRRDARRIGEHLRRLGYEPELIPCSSAARTRETLALVRLAYGTSAVMLEEELYAASCDESLARIRPVPDAVASVMLIGDNPRLQQLARVLASAGAGLERLNEKFPRAALATLAVANNWGRLGPADASSRHTSFRSSFAEPSKRVRFLACGLA
jgi:phosphohistidine phosphatase